MQTITESLALAFTGYRRFAIQNQLKTNDFLPKHYCILPIGTWLLDQEGICFAEHVKMVECLLTRAFSVLKIDVDFASQEKIRTFILLAKRMFFGGPWVTA